MSASCSGSSASGTSPSGAPRGSHLQPRKHRGPGRKTRGRFVSGGVRGPEGVADGRRDETGRDGGGHRSRLRTRAWGGRRGLRFARRRSYDHRPRRRHRPLPGDRLEADGGCRSRHPDRQALQDGCAGSPSRDDDRQGGDDARGTRDVHADRWTVCGGERGADDGRRGGLEGGGRDDHARRRVQAEDVAVLVPGARGRRSRDPARGSKAHRLALRGRGRRSQPGRARRRRRRLHQDRHTQRAELRAPERGRTGEQAGDAEARARR